MYFEDGTIVGTIADIQERYGSYLAELLEQYGYGQQDNNRGPKR